MGELLPQFPIYIPSKGRAELTQKLTVGILRQAAVPFRVVVEEHEHAEYVAAGHDPSSLLVLDPAYQRSYDTCDRFGSTKSKGPGPARNFIWDHSIAEGHEWHWVMDDNIRHFYRLHEDWRIRTGDGTHLRAMEDFATRYENVAMAGPAYYHFVTGSQAVPPFITNTRIYSCNLIRNDVPFRWRARYNEDTDLSLRMLKAGWCTIQFNAFLQDKEVTQQNAGGNTAEFYSHEGTRAKSLMLARLHPDVARLAFRYGRVHHHVDYRGFRAMPLKLKPEAIIPEGDPYAMKLKEAN